MKAQHTYAENNEQLSTILNSISDAVIATDQKGLVTFMNPVAEILTGWAIEEASGKQVTDILDIYVGNTGNLRKDTFFDRGTPKRVYFHRGIVFYFRGRR